VNPVLVVPYDPAWPEASRRAEGWIGLLLGDAASAIHHIGSTSVPGLCAKPILDVLVEASDLERIDALAPVLVGAGWIARGEYGIPGRRYFVLPTGTELRVDLYTFRRQDPNVVRLLRFRDHLRAHPAAAEAYGALKRRLASEHARDGDAYQEGKGPFVSRILAEAEASVSATRTPTTPAAP
jgi:GrpB-like predicted nucleotidyltransferase (UPF0157 family)